MYCGSIRHLIYSTPSSSVFNIPQRSLIKIVQLFSWCRVCLWCDARTNINLWTKREWIECSEFNKREMLNSIRRVKMKFLFICQKFSKWQNFTIRSKNSSCHRQMQAWLHNYLISLNIDLFMNWKWRRLQRKSTSLFRDDKHVKMVEISRYAPMTVNCNLYCL